MKSLNENPDSIARPLREEALADSPSFSPLLHARIMQQIQNGPEVAPSHTPSSASLHAQMNAPLQPPHSPYRLQWLIPTLATAAVAMLAATLWLRKLPQPLIHQAVVPPPSLPEFSLHFPDLAESTTASLTQAPYGNPCGNLDRDAKNVVSYMINQLDVIPTQPVRKG
jgi:hypothetical protein